MSLYSPTKNFIYIHIPKTGGTSIESLGVFGESYNKHYDIEYFKETYGDLSKIFKFTFVRDPYTRFASSVLRHAVPQRKPSSPIMELPPEELKLINKGRFTDYTLKNSNSFDDVVALKRQHGFLEIDGKIEMDFIGRFENLQEDFNRLCEGLGLGKRILPHEMKGTYNDYDWFYTKETREIVAEYYSKDFEMFNYEK